MKISQRNAATTPRLFLTNARFLTPASVLLLAFWLTPALVLAQGETRIIFEQNEVRIRAPALSPDGGYVAFTINKNERWLFNRETQSLELLFTTADLTGDFFNVSDRGLGASVSNEARFHPFWSDGNNGSRQVYLFDRDSGTIELVSRTPTGEEANGRSNRAVVTPDGRFVAFISRADNMVPDVNPSSNNIYLYDRTDSSVTLISRNLDGTPDDSSDENVDISDDGSRILFNSYGTKLVANDNNEQYHDVYLYDAAVGVISRINEPGGDQSDDANAHRELAISGDGQSVIWADSDTNLDPAKTSFFEYQLFLKDLPSEAISMASRSVDGNEPNNGLPTGGNPPLGISASGRFLFFQHYATDLIDNDETGGRADIFVLDRQTDEITVASLDENGDQVGPTFDDGDRPSLDSYFSVSNDGRFLVFVGRRHDTPTDILYLRDRGDVLAPVVSALTTNPTDPLPDDAVTLEATATDRPPDLASPIASVEYNVDDAGWFPMEAVDGAFDDSTEQAFADVGNRGVGLREYCVRATDTLNNVSQPQCITIGEDCGNGVDDDGDGLIDTDDEEDCPSSGSVIGLAVACLHDPIYPMTAGDAIEINARAIDSDGNPVIADVIEIWWAAPQTIATAPALAVENVETASFTFTPTGDAVMYSCYASRDPGGPVREDYHSGWRIVDIGAPDNPDFPAIPVLFNRGGLNRNIDIVFFPDEDDYPGGHLDQNFHQDVYDLINEGLHTIPWFVEFQDFFNFYLGRTTANSGPDPDDDDPSDGTMCLREAPDLSPWPQYAAFERAGGGYKTVFAFADAGAIVHTSACRDNAGSPGLFTIETERDRLQVIAHEVGHRPFGLSDEYCCDGGYKSRGLFGPPFHNLFRNESGCRTNAEDRGYDPDACRELFASGRNWWLFEPDFRRGNRVNQTPDLMQQSGGVTCSFDSNLTCDTYRVGISEVDRLHWMLDKCLDNKC